MTRHIRRLGPSIEATVFRENHIDPRLIVIAEAWTHDIDRIVPLSSGSPVVADLPATRATPSYAMGSSASRAVRSAAAARLAEWR